MRVTVPDFSPKLGLRFANAFPHEPVKEVDLPPPFGRIKLGDAARGLCGGMSFTVADLFATGSPPPEDPDPPDAGTERFDYLVDRQVDSLNRGWLPLRFYSLMSPLRPRREGPIPGIDDSRTYVMVHDEWPAIKAEIDKGNLAMIGLVKVVSNDPRQTQSQPPGHRLRVRPRRDDPQAAHPRPERPAPRDRARHRHLR